MGLLAALVWYVIGFTICFIYSVCCDGTFTKEDLIASLGMGLLGPGIIPILAWIYLNQWLNGNSGQVLLDFRKKDKPSTPPGDKK